MTNRPFNKIRLVKIVSPQIDPEKGIFQEKVFHSDTLIISGSHVSGFHSVQVTSGLDDQR